MTNNTQLPALSLSSSALLRRSLSDDRFHVADYMRDGAYPNHRLEKDEAEAYVALVVGALNTGRLPRLEDELARYLQAMFPPAKLTTARQSGSFDRLVGFAQLQRVLDDAVDDLSERSFDLPGPEDPVFAAHPQLIDRLDRDGLLVLQAGDVADEMLRAEGVISHEGTALYPHPLLAPMRELVAELLDLAGDPALSVSIALHPFRITAVEDVPMRLLEDYWSGIKVTVQNLDSLDPHDTGVRTFHGARDDAPGRFFLPLLGTWFDWERRSRHDPSDPVKRLYVREICPATNRHGEPLAAALNRELHAERDTVAHRFTHVDGKVCSYNADTYAPTTERPNADPGVPSRKRKLWRVDGPMTDELWRTLVGLHFRQNELIAEHFEAAFAPEPGGP